MCDLDANPFLDPARVRGDLYTQANRLARRSSTLLAAKTSGRAVPRVIVELAGQYSREAADEQKPPRAARIVDIGCGGGSSSRALRDAFPAAQLIMVDLSHELLLAARNRTGGGDLRTSSVQADFHSLPFAPAAVDLVVAAFCLYHSRDPVAVIAEVAHTLRVGGIAILVTKSRDSYRELDRLVAATGLDPAAERKPSLYESAHSENLASLAGAALRVERVLHELHSFRFACIADLAQYLSTTPKYNLTPRLPRVTQESLTEFLRRRLPDGPVETDSTVTYVVARRDR